VKLPNPVQGEVPLVVTESVPALVKSPSAPRVGTSDQPKALREPCAHRKRIKCRSVGTTSGWIDDELLAIDFGIAMFAVSVQAAAPEQQQTLG